MEQEPSNVEGSPGRGVLHAELEEEELQIIRASILEAMLWAFEDGKLVGERLNVIYGILRSLRAIIAQYLH